MTRADRDVELVSIRTRAQRLRRGPEMRGAIAIALLSFTALLLSSPARAADRPVAGDPVPAYEPVGRAVQAAMDRGGATAATAAVYVDGRPAYSRAFGWRDADKKHPARPDDLMRIASVSKPVTLAMVRSLVRQKKLSLDEPAFAYLSLPPPGTAGVDPRLPSITVAHLMAHRAGWDRDAAGDPMFRLDRVRAALALNGPATPADVVRYVSTQPLQFAPGERFAYSNVGYCVLGRVIEKATGTPYAAALTDLITGPLKIADDLKPGRSAAKDRDPREVGYPVADDAFGLEAMDAHGGLIASAPALCRFLQAYWIGGSPRPRPGAKGGTDAFSGSLPGTTALVLQRPNGADVAVLLNARRDRFIDADMKQLLKELTAAVDEAPALKR